MSTDKERLVAEVRDRYGRIAEGDVSGCGCGTPEQAAALLGYSTDDLAALPDGANLGLGCGAPLTFLDPRPGETVLDLGSGAGIDALLAAKRVGPGGRVIGVDMTPSMLEKARENARAAGCTWVEFREGRLERLPVDAASIDAVTSNCVINLVPDKSAVFREVARVLRPSGRLVVSDIVLDAELPGPIVDDVLAYVGCISGALRREDYFGRLRAAGFREITIHRDVDYLAASGYAIDPAILAKLAAHGSGAGSLDGVVRSITYGARR